MTTTGPRARGDLPDAEDIAALTPASLRATRFSAGADELVVFSFPLRSVTLPDVLSEGECEVALGLLEGLSNAEIGARRGTSARTVANQVASIFRKLDVSSRTELQTRLMSSPAEGDG